MTEGDTEAAGAGLSDKDFADRVAGQTSNDLKAEDVFQREQDGASSDGEAADIDAEDLSES